MNKYWPFVFNILFFAGVASMAPFIILYYQSVGFTGTQIGLLTGITPLVTLFCSLLWTSVADTTLRHRLLMSIAILGGSIAIFIFPLVNTFLPVLLIATLFFAFFAPIPAFADSATMFMLADQKEMYGRIRLGGTIGFGATATVAGLIVQNYGLRYAFWGCAMFMVLAFIISQKFHYSQTKATHSNAGGMRVLLTNRRWIPFLMLAFAGGLAFTTSSNYLFAYMKELGANESTMGLALTISTLSEFPIFFFGNRLVQRFKPAGLLILALVITGLRLLLFFVASTPTVVLFIQLLQGFTFPAMWMAGVAYADENAPVGMAATAQGMFGAMVMGFGAAVGGFVGGPLLENLGGRGLYLVFGIAVLLIVAIAALMQNRLPDEQKTASVAAAIE